MKRLPKAQERRLFARQLSGDFGPGSWSTIEALLRGGYLAYSADGRQLYVTERGRSYCHAVHYLESDPALSAEFAALL